MTQAGGFETGSDFVAARVSFDIDSNGISTLRELSEELNRYRTATEAASRTTSDFTKYIQQMTQLANQASEAQTNLVNQLQRMADSQQSLMTGQGTQVSRGAPQGYVNPFSGMGGGNGAGTANRPPTIGDASSYLGGMAQQDPRQYFNMQSGWGNVRAGDLPAASPSDNDLIKHAQRHQARDKAQSDQAASSRIADPLNSAQQRISGMTSGAASLLSELGPGGNGMGLASLAQQGLMSLSGSMRKSAAAAGGVKDGSAPMGTADDAAGAAGNVAGMLGGLKSFAGTGLGAASLGVGAAVGGMALFQQGGEMVQGYRSMGQMRGGGLQEGLGYEMAIKSMALSPFITTDQARQIVSQGLSSGYTGKEFDTVTQFMAQNLKDMNMSAAESMKVFKKNVSEGGMSAEGLSGELGALKQASKTGYSSTADLVSSYAGTSGALISAGVSGPSASNAAATAAVMFKDDASLKDIGGAVMQSAASNPTIGAMLMNPQLSGVNLPRGTTPRSAMEALGGDPTAIINIMRFYARQFSSSGSKAVAVDGFQMWLQRTFPGVGDFQDRTKVEKLMTRLLSGENIVGKANKEMEASRAAQVKTRDATASFGSVVGGVAGGLGAMVETGWAGVQDFFGNLFNQEEGFSSGNPSWKRTSKAADEFTLATSDRRSNQLDIIAREHGIGNLEVGTGNSWKQLDPRNVQMVKDLESGKLKIRERGQGPGMTLRETVGGDGGLNPQSSGPNAFSIAPQNVNVGGVLKVTVEDNRQVQVDNEVRLTPTQDAAAEGWNGAQYNNPTPGDRRRQRG